MAEEPKPAAGQPAQTATPLEVVDDASLSLYSNFCRVTGTPEELIIDFGLNATPMDPHPKPIQVTQRIIVNFWTAKRLLHALAMSVQRHESLFGVLETDIQKRVVGTPGGQARPQA